MILVPLYLKELHIPRCSDILGAKMSYDKSSFGVMFPDYALLQDFEAEDLLSCGSVGAGALEWL